MQWTDFASTTNANKIANGVDPTTLPKTVNSAVWYLSTNATGKLMNLYMLVTQKKQLLNGYGHILIKLLVRRAIRDQTVIISLICIKQMERQSHRQLQQLLICMLMDGEEYLLLQEFISGNW